MNQKNLLYGILGAVAIVVTISFVLAAKQANETADEVARRDSQVRETADSLVDELNGTDSGVANLIKVTRPASKRRISSPLEVTGEARGNWYFEGSFPVRLLDEAGRVVATGIALAKDDWMTTDFVPFAVTLTYADDTSGIGTLVLEKGNPSGALNPPRLEVTVQF